MTEFLEHRMREKCTFACFEGEENHNMPAISFLLEKEETKRKKLLFWVCKIFHKLKKENQYSEWFLLGLTEQFQNHLLSISN